MITLLASAARAVSGSQALWPASGNPPSPIRWEKLESGVFVLDVSAAAAAVGDTLDVYLQSAANPEAGAASAFWDDFVHFTQALGNGGAKRFLAYWIRDYIPTTGVKAPQDAALAAGVQQGPYGEGGRVKWVIAGASPSFTFSLGLSGLKYR